MDGPEAMILEAQRRAERDYRSRRAGRQAFIDQVERAVEIALGQRTPLFDWEATRSTVPLYQPQVQLESCWVVG